MFRLQVIIGTIPNSISNGQTEDAVPVMANFNWIISQVNANAAPLSNTALLSAANSFTAVQSGLAATSPANFPIASQVQSSAFLTFQSTLGTNALTARVAALALTAWPTDAIFSWIPSQTNTGPAGFSAVDSAGSSSIFSGGAQLVGGELRLGVPAMAKRNSSRLELYATPYSRGTNMQVFGYLNSEVSGTRGFTLSTGLGIQGAIIYGAARGAIAGLQLSTAGGSANITVASGATTDDTSQAAIGMSSSMVKTTGAWATGSGNGGLDTGVIAANTWYHFFVIMRPDTGVDVVFSLSSSAPSVPAGYAWKRLIGSWITDGASQWASIVQTGDRFEWVTPGLAGTHTNPGTAAVTRSLSSGVPTNRSGVIAIITVSQSLAAVGNALYVSALDTTDSAPSGTAAPLATVWTPANNTAMVPFEVRVDANASIRLRNDGSDASTVNRLVTRGWIDRRGRDS